MKPGLAQCCASLIPLSAAMCLAQAPPVIKSETRLVVVNVVVTDKKGAYVHDLTAKDFRLFDDNKEQPIQSFSVESSAAGPARQTDYMVVAFDDAGMSPSDQVRARQAAARFIDANAGPARRIASANIDNGLRITQGFTDSAGRLKEAISKAKPTVSAAIITGNNAAPGAPDPVSDDRYSALISMASDLNAAPGRKAIILFTGKLTATSAQKAALARAIEVSNRSNVAIYPVDVREAALPSNLSAENEAGGRGGRGGAGRGGRGPRGARGDTDPDIAADPNGFNQQVLFALASGTGGFVVPNANELPSGLQKAGEEQGEYYVLGFTPPDSPSETCHALKVKTDRGGLTLRARSSYCTGGAPSLVTANPVDNDLAKRAAASQSGDIEASMQLPFFYESPGVARVDVVMSIQPGSFKLAEKQGRLHADVNILGIASTPDGETGGRFNDTLTLDFDAADQTWKQKPVRYQKEFKIAPGQDTLTVVFSTGGESFGKLTRPLTIEPYQPGKLALSGLALGTETRREADSAASSLFDDRAALSVNGIEYVPAGSAVFSRSDQPFCYFEIYPAGSGPAHRLELRVLDAKSGNAAWDSGEAKVELPMGKTSVPVSVSVPAAKLAPGSYRLEVKVTDTMGATAQRSAPFEVK